MAKLIPFRAFRPTRDKVHLVASRSYVSYTPAGLKWKLDSNPFSFIHIINPDYRVPGRKSRGKCRFQLVKEKFKQFCDDKIFLHEEKESLYIYRQTFHGLVFTGIVGGASVDDYFNGHIKRHEATIKKREVMFRDYLDICGFNAEPVLLTYPKREGLEEVLDKYLSQRPEYEFSSANNCLHELWPVNDESDIQGIQNYFSGIEDFYIADGHHRVSSSALLSKTRGGNNSLVDYFMAYFIPEDQLTIWDFNRVIKDLNYHSPEEYLDRIRENFDLMEVSDHPIEPLRIHQMTMYLDQKWYRLDTKKECIDHSDPVGDLDAQILTKYVLNPIHDIHDLSHDNRIGFVNGISGMEGLERKVNSGKFQVAFALYPVSFSQLQRVADAGMIMPPKSTYIEPKLRSGLLIYPFDESNS